MVSISHAIITTTVYTIEITSKEFRGSFSVLESVLRCTGSVLVYALGFSFRWWEIASFASLVPITAFISCMFVPESPVFLVKKGRLAEAELSFSRTFGPDRKNGTHLNWNTKPGIWVLTENRLAFKLERLARNFGPDQQKPRI